MTTLTAARMDGEYRLSVSQGIIHSIFSTAINILIYPPVNSCRNPGQIKNKLNTLLAAGRCLYPQSLVLAENITFLDRGFEIGDSVSINEGSIQLGNKAIVSTSDAERIALSIPPFKLNIAMDITGYKAKMKILSGTLCHSENAGESLAPVLGDIFGIYDIKHNVWSRFITERLRGLFNILRSQDKAACFEAAKNIAGCGPGFTPASDDFLVGVFASMYGAFAAKILDMDTTICLCKNLYEGARLATGDLSAVFLERGANGYFNEDVIRLIINFFTTEDMNTFTRSAKQVSLNGSTSGVDTLTGIWFGLAVCLPSVVDMGE